MTYLSGTDAHFSVLIRVSCVTNGVYLPVKQRAVTKERGMFRTSLGRLRWSLLWTAGLALALLASSSLVSAQGVQTGIVTGLVVSSDNLPLPGVTVTASSPALQGKRSAVTDVNGVLIIKGLPAGTYALDFELSQFEPAKSQGIS